jgi:hypothetical protein
VSAPSGATPLDNVPWFVIPTWPASLRHVRHGTPNARRCSDTRASDLATGVCDVRILADHLQRVASRPPTSLIKALRPPATLWRRKRFYRNPGRPGSSPRSVFPQHRHRGYLIPPQIAPPEAAVAVHFRYFTKKAHPSRIPQLNALPAFTAI